MCVAGFSPPQFRQFEGSLRFDLGHVILHWNVDHSAAAALCYEDGSTFVSGNWGVLALVGCLLLLIEENICNV